LENILKETLYVEAGSPIVEGSQVYETSLEAGFEPTLPETLDAPAADEYISELEGFSKDDLISFANDLDMILSPVMDVHASTTVYCERLGGAEMTLSEAINAIWPASNKGAMFKEGIPSVMAEIQKMLANRPPEVKKPEEGQAENPEEEFAQKENKEEHTEDAAAKAEEKDGLKLEDNAETGSPPVSQGKSPINEQGERDAQKAKQQEPVATVPAQGAKDKIAPEAISAEAAPGAAKDKLGTVSQQSATAEVSGGSSKDFAGPVPAHKHGAKEIAGVAAKEAEIPAQKSTLNQEAQKSAQPNTAEDHPSALPLNAKSKIEPKQQIAVSEVVQPDVLVAEATVEVRPAIEPLDFEEQGISFTLSDFQEPAVEIGPTDLLIVTEEAVVVAEQDGEVVDEDFDLETTEDLEAESLELRIGAVGLDFLVEEVSDSEDNSEIEGELIIPTVEDDPDPTEQARTPIAETQEIAQLSLPAEKVEDALNQIVERIEYGEPEEAQAVEEILDRIIETSKKFEAGNNDNIFQRFENQKEIEELFTELLEKLEVEPSPELAESLAYLTIRWHLAAQAKFPQEKQETDITPTDTGTNEVIKQILIGLSDLRKTMVYAGVIGRSALRLSFSF
jgi:GTPase SAR1 family protein